MAVIKTKLHDGRPIMLNTNKCQVLIGIKVHNFDTKVEAQKFYFGQLQEGLKKALKDLQK